MTIEAPAYVFHVYLVTHVSMDLYRHVIKQAVSHLLRKHLFNQMANRFLPEAMPKYTYMGKARIRIVAKLVSYDYTFH